MFTACSEAEETSLAGLTYFPPVSKLKKGLVWKYYFHIKKEDGQPVTNIIYRKANLKGNSLYVEDYNAAFERTYAQEFLIENGQWISLNECYYRTAFKSQDPVKENKYDIIQNTNTAWNSQTGTLELHLMEEGNGRQSLSKQLSQSDSINENKSIKLFNGIKTVLYFTDSLATDTTVFNWHKRYEEGMGMTYSKNQREAYTYEYKLDKIMSIKAFEKLADHGTHRVAYIDTLKTLDDHTLFKPCYHPSLINDYYNDEKSGFKGSKGRLRSILKEKLNNELLKGESGYLTFRFVVNCDGQAGWFTTEEAGLDFERKSFSDDLRMQLFNILKAEPDWKKLTIRKEASDAYTYITFKIKNDEVIEILP